MKVDIRDTDALASVSPAELSAYARTEGWVFAETYGDHSDVYTRDGHPEIIVPRTQRLGDYARVVSQLIDIFTAAAEVDQISLFRDLLTADRDVIRVRVGEGGGSHVAVNAGVDLVKGARDMLLAAACSVGRPQAVYRAGANQEANDYLNRVRLGQTEEGSYVVTLYSPVIPPLLDSSLPQEPSFGRQWQPPDEEPAERRVTTRLAEALEATRDATERTAGGDAEAFPAAVVHGVSANLCDALVTLINPFYLLDVNLVWARTRPKSRAIASFGEGDLPVLQEAARLFRLSEPQPNVRLFGFVQVLNRRQDELDGRITLRASVDDKIRSVVVVLSQTAYRRAIQAHDDRAIVIIEGDLERVGQRWHLLNPNLIHVIDSEESAKGPGEGSQLDFEL